MKKNGNRSGADLVRLRRKVETFSTSGLLLVAVGLVAPFVSVENVLLQTVFRWVYAVGAIVYTVARMIDVNDPADSLRLRRLRRLEMWAGFCFCAGAGFWFYNAWRLKAFLFSMGVMKDTVMFTLAGALIQIIASWMIAHRMAKESADGKAADKR